ncbi:hypothetical protein RQP46_011262 [Phenoliferia psychrophenolica]
MSNNEESNTESGRNQPEEIYKPSEHDGLRKDGQPDKRLNPEHGFGGRPKEEVKELAAQGGRASGGGQKEEEVDPDYVE